MGLMTCLRASLGCRRCNERAKSHVVASKKDIEHGE